MLILISWSVLGLIGVLAALASGPSRARRSASLAIALAGLGTPFIVPPEHTFWRTLAALNAALVLMRSIDLARDPTLHPLHVRMAMVFCIFDLRRVRAMAPRVELRLLVIGLAYTGVSLTAYYLALHAPTPWRWLLGAIGVYCMADSFAALVGFFGQSVGSEIPKQHDKPILSRSVREFWSMRWNLNVRDWLFRHCHRPLARRGQPALGIVCAFLVSTLIHFWMVLVPLGWFWATVMGSFFVVQGLLVLLETRVSVARLPPAMRHAWTVLAVLGPSPLFVEPALRLMG